MKVNIQCELAVDDQRVRLVQCHPGGAGGSRQGVRTMSIKSHLPEILRLFAAGHSPSEIAESIGATANYVRELLNRTRPGSVKQKYGERIAAARASGKSSEEIAIRLLKGEPVRKISREVGLSYSAVWSIGRRVGMRKKTAIKHDRAVAMARRWERGESQRAIARAYGISQMAVSKAIRRVRREAANA